MVGSFDRYRGRADQVIQARGWVRPATSVARHSGPLSPDPSS